MSLIEIASIVAGLGIGYWLVSLFTGRHDEVAFTAPPQAEADPVEARWHEVLEVSEWASDEDVATAYREKMRQYHPDKVATLGPEIRALAERKARQINAAYEEAMRRR